MSKQRYYQQKSRWNRFKKMNKRRVNMFLQAKRVENLESKLADEAELAKQNREQIDELLSQLELKIGRTVAANKKLKLRVAKLERAVQTPKASLFAMFKRILCSKGEP